MINTSFQAKKASKKIILFYMKASRLHIGTDGEYTYISDGYQVTRIKNNIVPMDLNRFFKQTIMKEPEDGILYDVTEGGIDEKNTNTFKNLYEESIKFDALTYTGLVVEAKRFDAYVFSGNKSYIYVDKKRINGLGAEIEQIVITGTTAEKPIYFEKDGFEHYVMSVRTGDSYFLKNHETDKIKGLNL
jgi:hypothetical protein